MMFKEAKCGYRSEAEGAKYRYMKSSDRSFFIKIRNVKHSELHVWFNRKCFITVSLSDGWRMDEALQL